ncbi:MAG: hypothetical protein H0U74_20465 [Bradymonadaceae bacterium]|nr:hypothetical protein [Lujinxingiaceae bacterium]
MGEEDSKKVASAIEDVDLERENDVFDEEDFDPELMELAEERSRGSLLRPILMIAVILFGASIINDWRDNIAYFFASSEPVNMGNVTEYPLRMSEEPGWVAPLVHNRYVTMSGVPTRRSQSERYNYFKLVGGEIYVEAARDDYIKNALERELATKKVGDVDRTFFSGSGRLIAFSQISDRYGGLRRYYSQRYNTQFCEQYDERSLAELARRRRETILANWALEYEQASPELREQKGLRPEPSAAELEEVFNSEPLCVNAYLVQVGTQPRDHWWHVTLAALIGFFVVFNTVMLARWIIHFFKP